MLARLGCRLSYIHFVSYRGTYVLSQLSGMLRNRCSEPSLYHHLEEADCTVFDGYISDILIAKYIYRILRDTIGCAFGSGGYRYHISEENFRPLFANPELVDKLLEERPPETDDERFVFRVYQAFKHGGKDEFGEASVMTAEAVELSL